MLVRVEFMTDGNFESLGSEDVVLFGEGTLHRQPRLLETVAVITESSTKALESWPYIQAIRNLNGVSAKVLSPSGGGWQEGKIRVRVVIEFEKDEQLPPSDAPT
jgi:hypothetical protein